VTDRPVLEPDAGGFYCPAGDFWIDPAESVDRAVVTHAHADHLATGHDECVVSSPTVPLAERRTEAGCDLRGWAFAEQHQLGDADVSLHPAGHILGSAQIRVEVDGRVWVVSGDYKRQPDPTCRDFELVECDVFVTEATYGLPIYRWDTGEAVARRIFEWWCQNRDEGRPSVLFCYAVGKAQRVLAHLDALTDRTIFLHGAVTDFVELYREAGVSMPPTAYATGSEETDFSGKLVLAPTSAHGSAWMERFPSCRTGFASGWMRVRAFKRRRGYEAGFVLSDHCDWEALLRTIRETGAERVVAEHGDTGPLVRFLREELDIEAVGLDRERDDQMEGA
jgi:putative mRNA 3-end processing factor